MKWLEITVTTAPPAVEAIANIFLEARSGGVAETSLPPGLAAESGAVSSWRRIAVELTLRRG